MCNYLYYWVTVRNSQSYWHLEHMGENTGMYTGQGGVGEGGGAREGGRRGMYWMVGEAIQQGWG